jgi:hypothetical protein
VIDVAALTSLDSKFIGDGSWLQGPSPAAPGSWPTRAAINDFCSVCGLPQGAAEEIGTVSAKLEADQLARRLFERCRLLLFSAQPPARDLLVGWNGLSGVLGSAFGAFNVILLASELHRLRALYAARGIGSEVLCETLGDAALWARKFRNAHGCWGLAQIIWLNHHLRGDLFRLGRLQFMHIAFPWNMHAFAEDASSRVVALAGSGILVRTDGLIDGTNNIEDPRAWTAELIEDAHGWTGSPVFPSGVVSKRSVHLDRGAWKPFLSQGSGCIDIHITEGESLDPDACRNSLLHARSFFRHHFPEKPWSAFHLCTWLLDPQLRALLGSGSRIARFQEEFYLLPIKSDESQTYERVFGSSTINLSTAPRDTALQRAIIGHVAAGCRMRSSVGFIRPEDLDREGGTGYQAASARAIEKLAGTTHAAG